MFQKKPHKGRGLRWWVPPWGMTIFLRGQGAAREAEKPTRLVKSTFPGLFADFVTALEIETTNLIC